MGDLSSELLDDLRRQRWFAAKDRAVRGARVVDRAAPLGPTSDVRLELVAVDFAAGPSETYVLVRSGEVLDALGSPGVADALLERTREGAALPTEQGGALLFARTYALQAALRRVAAPPTLMAGEQSNTSIRYGDALILKLFRRLQPGINPELEVGRFLTERTSFRHAPRLAASLEYRAPDGACAALAILQTFVPNRGDAWSTTLERLAGVLAGERPEAAVRPMRRLGEVTASLHLALSSVADDPAFAPQPVSDADTRRWTRAIESQVARAAAALQARGVVVPMDRLLARARGVEALRGSLKIRHHGDYHLGQVLEQPDGDFTVIDFEGEPLKPLEARRERASPLRDAAGMLRSFDYARHAALRMGEADDPARVARAEAWHHAARDAFLTAYAATIQGGRSELLPALAGSVDRALAAFEIEKAAYEVLYELTHRPDWLPIPRAAFQG